MGAAAFSQLSSLRKLRQLWVRLRGGSKFDTINIPSLESVKLENPAMSHKLFSSLLSNCPNIKALDCSGTYVPHPLFDQRLCNNLTVFICRMALNVEHLDEELAYLLSVSPLRVLELSSAKVTERFICDLLPEQTLVSFLNRVQCLYIQSCYEFNSVRFGKFLLAQDLQRCFVRGRLLVNCAGKPEIWKEMGVSSTEAHFLGKRLASLLAGNMTEVFFERAASQPSLNGSYTRNFFDY